ncbi:MULTISPECIES: hypothetical protein [Photorhabdus]|uniref:Uncharacterized protein n=2 Tax=Photorhabdus TaxID=29487 RepID=A0ABX0B160_9GAMM|nr:MULTISPECIES: hypothetical protein [Photorhabdus]MCC8373360.1 hypothetical protein [Photorhabdus bodei]MCC8466501.1 hypothetical protein [Photorhabdus bodei]MCT8352706.1 hypothetical protein [Photorhabdus kayaii]MDB6370813.1 hypothetical protein [Photorhabdus bodei]NDL10800.1 hypothetical protein [Photorhabdus kayaii]
MSISLQKRQLPYQPDAAINYFAPISNQSWAMLLHSGAANHPHNRFDILVAEPRMLRIYYAPVFPVVLLPELLKSEQWK